eukprot:TRINITY_DN14415_c0_g1_i1.p1 TRINITY_DN14415_c0_g1~~TRINITY_DN14415_c0_g1_i1.p1  ORF type:complete len:321 (+),score=95.00 TRINITY_DN14415_c0_g1_i1:120-1082(+)
MWSYEPPQKPFVDFSEDINVEDEDPYSPIVPAWKMGARSQSPVKLDEESLRWVAQNVDPTHAKRAALPPINRTAKDILDVLKQKITGSKQPGLKQSHSIGRADATLRRTRSEIVQPRLPRVQTAATHASTGRMARQASDPQRGHARAKPSGYMSKYSPELVELLRDFYKEIMADGTVENQQRAFTAAIQKKLYSGLDTVEFRHLLDSSGKLTFKSLVRRVFPLASTRDVASMILWAFPPNRKEEVQKEMTQKERAELIELFKLWDTDGSQFITLEEFIHGMKDLSLPKADLISIFQHLDKDHDDLLSMEEFIDGMHRTYF